LTRAWILSWVLFHLMRYGCVGRVLVTNKHLCVNQVQDSIPRKRGESAPNTTEGTVFALTEAEVLKLRPLARRLHSLMIVDNFLTWTFLLAVREADLPLKLRRAYISQVPRLWRWEHHHHLILTPYLRDLHVTLLFGPTWPAIFKSFANLAPNIEFLTLGGVGVLDSRFPVIDEHTLHSITALLQLKSLRLPPIPGALLMKLLPKLALLSKLEALYLEDERGDGQLEWTPFIGFPALRSLEWGHSITSLPHLFQSIRSPNFSSLHISHCGLSLSSVLRDVLLCMTKLYGSTLTSFIYRVLSLWSLDHNVIRTPHHLITIDALRPLLDCQNLTTLELTSYTGVRLLPDDIQRICGSLSKLRRFQAATDITDGAGNPLLTTIDLQPFARLPDLERLFIQFDGSNITTNELEGILESTSRLQYFDVANSVPPASPRAFVSAMKRMFPQLESLSYDTATDSTESELSDSGRFEDIQKPSIWDKVASMLKRKRRT